MPDKLTREQVQARCDEFLRSLGRPAFMVFGWKKEDGSMDLVELLREVPPQEYVKGMVWALHEVTKQF